MAASFRSKVEGAEGESSTYALKSSAAVGDLVLFDLFVTTESAVTIPGLTVVQVKSGGFSYVVGYGLATSAEQTFTASWGGSTQFRAGSVTAYKEPNATAPVAAKASEAGASSKTITWPSVTPGVENCLDVLIAIQGGVKTGATGYTQRTNRFPEYVADKALTSGGATGTVTAEMTTSEGPIVFRFAVAPKASGPKTLSLTDSTTPTESLTKKAKKGLSDSTTPSESFTKKTTKQLTETATATEAWSFELVEDEPEPEPEPGGPNRFRIFERPPLRQYLLATTPGGRVERWGEDELNPANVIEGLTDSGSVPGGDKEISGSLPRKPGIDYSDMQMGTKVQLFGAGQKLLRECRLERVPRTSGDHLTMDPAAMGYQVLLTDDEGAREIFIDADQSGWGDPSAARKTLEALKTWSINGNGQTQLLASGGTAATPSAPAIAHMWTQMKAGVGSPDVIENWYDGGGVELGRVIAEFIPVKGVGASVTWEDAIYSSFDGQGSGAVKLWDFDGAAGVQELGIEWGKFFLFLQEFWNAAIESEGVWETHWRNLRVLGRHGLQLGGPWAAGGVSQVGVLASDVIAYALRNWAPGIRFTTGPYGSLKGSYFFIPHLVFKEPTTVQEMITAALKYELLEWSVKATEKGPTFFLNPRGEREGRMKWRARVRPAKLTETGQQMDQVYNRCVVSFAGFDGKQHTVGPPRSGAEFTSSRCEDADPLNPINQVGEDRTKHISLNDPATPEGGAEAAQRFLEQCKLLDGSGEATLTGYVEDEHGAEWPYYCVQEGDLIEFIDSSIPGYRYIVEAAATRSSRSTQIHIDAPPDSYTALLERLGAREAAAGLG